MSKMKPLKPSKMTPLSTVGGSAPSGSRGRGNPSSPINPAGKTRGWAKPPKSALNPSGRPRGGGGDVVVGRPFEPGKGRKGPRKRGA